VKLVIYEPITKLQQCYKSDLVVFRAVFLLATLFLSAQIQADSLHLIINGKAMHENKKNYNEDNWGLGFEYDFEEKEQWVNFVTGSFFKDSLSNTSKYIGGGSKRRYYLEDDKDGWHVDAGLVAFIMTRKDHNNNEPFFGALPFISVGTKRFALNITYIPSVSPKLESLLFVQGSIQIMQW